MCGPCLRVRSRELGRYYGSALIRMLGAARALLAIVILLAEPANAQQSDQGAAASSSGSSSRMDVICNTMIVGTFCTDIGGAHFGGWEGNGRNGTAGAPTPSIPPCPSLPEPNELCN